MKYKGFAIIELIVVIIVVSLVLAIVISNFQKVRLQLSLSRAAFKLDQDLRLVQEMSLAGMSYKDSSGNEQKIDGYGIHIDINSLGNKKYIIYADKNLGNQEYDASDYLVGEINLNATEPGVEIKEIKNVSSGKASVNFSSSKIETKIIQLNPDQNNIEVVFTLESDPTKTKSVLVNTSGLIETK